MHDELPILSRLALAYAPVSARAVWLTALTLDARLAGVVRAAREPVLAQLKLAWWRDRLAQNPAARPQGEPLLGKLADWQDGGASLAPLVDGWEALLGDPPLPAEAINAFAAGRAALIGDLAQMVGADRAGAEARARRWALADLALHLGQGEERDAVHHALEQSLQVAQTFEKSMRPLLILERLSTRASQKGAGAALSSPVDLLVAMRLGLLGR
jgi:phytoene synthase